MVAGYHRASPSTTLDKSNVVLLKNNTLFQLTMKEGVKPRITSSSKACALLVGAPCCAGCRGVVKPDLSSTLYKYLMLNRSIPHISDVSSGFFNLFEYSL